MAAVFSHGTRRFEISGCNIQYPPGERLRHGIPPSRRRCICGIRRTSGAERLSTERSGLDIVVFVVVVVVFKFAIDIDERAAEQQTHGRVTAPKPPLPQGLERT